MSKQTTPLSVMIATPIKDGSYLLKHKLDTVTQKKLTDATALYFKTVPRVKHSGTKHITLHNCKYGTGEERLLALIAVKTWGWSKDRTYANQLQVARGASRLFAYNNGYSSPFSHYLVMT